MITKEQEIMEIFAHQMSLKDEEIARLRRDIAQANAMCKSDELRVEVRRKDLELSALRAALKNAAHWFNEQIRLYNDASQSLFARNFQIENFAKIGFDICLTALKTVAATHKEKP